MSRSHQRTSSLSTSIAELNAAIDNTSMRKSLLSPTTPRYDLVSPSNASTLNEPKVKFGSPKFYNAPPSPNISDVSFSQEFERSASRNGRYRSMSNTPTPSSSNSNLNKSTSNFDFNDNGNSERKLSTSSSTMSLLSTVSNAETSKNFKVVVRCRPPVPRELDSAKQFANVVTVANDNSITISEVPPSSNDDTLYAQHSFTFDHVYGENCTQRDVYEQTARDAVLSTLTGYNASIIAYGQTGTGKTHTMEGVHNDENQRGIIPRSIEEIFSYIQSTASPQLRFLVRASYLQIYNEVICDLLKPERNNLIIREDKRRGLYVEGLSEWVVRSPAEIYGLMERGANVRTTGATKMNEMSSRSHAIFIVIVEQTESELTDDNQEFKVGKLNLVDLAGSERVRVSGATGVRLEETKQINKSLSALGNVISALTEMKNRSHIPYRDSKLTRILEDSLGGNCKTTMMAMISPALEAFMESLSTLKFANRAKNIKNLARVNEDLDEKALLRRYEKELQRLRNELAEKQQNVVDKRKLLEVEEQRRRAEQDKLAAIIDLERLSRDLMAEKKEKKRLEAKIKEMDSQLLVGGVNESPALKSEQDKIRKEYEEKLTLLDKERQTMEEDKAQVDRYKQLLLKQRDIMIQLTVRLNERDQSILQLQEELDDSDKQQKQLEENIDQKTAALLTLQKLAIELQNQQGVLSKDPSALASALHDLVTPVLGNNNNNNNNATSPAVTPSLNLESKASWISDDKLMDIVSSISNSESDEKNIETLKSKLAYVINMEVEIKARGLQREMPSDAPEASLIASLMNDSDQLRSENNRLQSLLESRTVSSVLVDETNGDMLTKLEELRDSNAKYRIESSTKIKLKNDALKNLEDENVSLRQKLRDVESKSNQQAVQGGKSHEFDTMKARLEEHQKERVALKTILENKMKVIVDDVASALNAADPTKPFTSSRVKREVDILQRLVNASVHALQISSSDVPSPVQPPLTPSQSSVFKVPDPIDLNNRRPSSTSIVPLSADAEARRGSLSDSDYSANVFSAEKNAEQNSELNNVFFINKPTRPSATPTPTSKKENMTVDEMIAQRRAQLMQNSNK